MAATNQLKVWFGIFSLGIFFFGCINYYKNVEKNKCEMTYMFEYPQYIKQDLPIDTSSKFRQYQLYLYGEGKYADELRHKKLQGLPVLFIPGNAGSHRQVRSFASVALRMSQSLHSSFHFNFFSIDYNEELSAIFGGVLWSETEYLKECIAYIQSLYSEKRGKPGIIILAHSMGGMIAKALFTLPDFDYSTVSMVYNMATPHRAPVLDLDRKISEFYETVNGIWEAKRKSDLKSIPVINIGGAERDYLVRSDLVIPESQHLLDVNVLTTAVPRVWLSTDHLCIVWCKQLVLTVVQSMFELTSEIFIKESRINNLTVNILKHYFKRRSNALPYKHLIPFPPFPFAYSCKWILQDQVSWRYIKNKLLETTCLLVPLVEGEVLIVFTTGLETEDWIIACQKLDSNSSACGKGESVSDRAQLVGDSRMLMHISSRILLSRGHTHIAIHLSPSHTTANKPMKQFIQNYMNYKCAIIPSPCPKLFSSNVGYAGKINVSKGVLINILAERYRPLMRHKILTLPNLLQSLTTFTTYRLLNVPITEGAVFYNLSLKGLTEVWQAYVLTVETVSCKVGPSGDGLAKLVVPWGHEDRYFVIRPQQGAKVQISGRLYIPQPLTMQKMVQLHLILPSECSFTVSVQIHLSILAAQFVKFYGTMVFAYVTALLLVSLGSQLRTLDDGGTCLPILSALSNYPTFVMLALLPELFLQFMSAVGLTTILPMPDDVLIHKWQHHFILLRTILYAVSYGVVALLVFSSGCALRLVGWTIMWVRNSCLHIQDFTRNPKGELSFFVATGSCIFAAGLLVLPGAAVLFGIFFLVFFKLSSLCGWNRFEENRRGPSISTTRWHMQQSIYLLKLLVCAVVSPALLSWIKAFRYSFWLHNDPHILIALVIILSGVILWQSCIPCRMQVHAKSVSNTIFFIAILTTTHCLLSIWRIGYFLAAVFAIVAAQQIASWSRQVKVE